MRGTKAKRVRQESWAALQRRVQAGVRVVDMDGGDLGLPNDTLFDTDHPKKATVEELLYAAEWILSAQPPAGSAATYGFEVRGQRLANLATLKDALPEGVRMFRNPGDTTEVYQLVGADGRPIHKFAGYLVGPVAA